MMATDEFLDLSTPYIRKPRPRPTIDATNRKPLNVYDPKFEENPLMGSKYADKYKKEQMKNLSLSLGPGKSGASIESHTNIDRISVITESVTTKVKESWKDETENIYNHYNFNLTKTMNKKLTILNFRKQILQGINENPVLVMQGETGCGKSTQVPQMILEDCQMRNEPCNIIVTQPRRIACVSIAKKVATERECSVGTLIGYQIGLDACINEDTRILYCTTGVLLQKLISFKRLTNYTHIVLDEVHERSEEMDFLLIVIRLLLSTNSSNVKIILMSATIETKRFAEYFMISKKLAPIICMNPGSVYTVTTYYLDDLKKKIKETPDINYLEPGISNGMYGIAAELCDACNGIDEREHKKHEMDPSLQPFVRGAILIFLPGVYEIEKMHNALTNNRRNISYDIKVLHSRISTIEQQNVHQKASDHQRKVILATNIAESSITLPDVKYILDFCLTKANKVERFTNFSMLCTEWASKNNCRQRAGRCGRVMNGRVYRLVHKDFFHNNLSESNACDLLRCPLENAVLKSKMLNMGPPYQILGLAMDPPDLSDIKRTILILKESGALLKGLGKDYDEFDGELTYIGYVMAHLPLHISLSKLIIIGYMFDILDESIIIASGLSGKNLFPMPYNDKFEAYSYKLIWSNGSGSDCIAILNAYNEWSILREQRKIFNENNWAHRYYVDLKSLREMHLLILDIQHRLKSIGIISTSCKKLNWTKNELPFILNITIAGAFYPNYFVYTKGGDDVDEVDLYSEIEGRNPCTTVYMKGFDKEYIGPLYTKCLKQYFKTCVTSADNIKISFPNNSSKIFITFKNTEESIDESQSDFKPLMPGFVATEVFKAIKLGQIQKHISLNVAGPANARKYAKSLNFGTTEGGTWRKNTKIYNDLHLYAIPPQNQAVMNGIVTKVIHCNKFWFQVNNNNYKLIFKKLNEIPMESYNTESDITIGEIVAVKYENNYCRGKVYDITPKNQIIEFRIDLIDFAVHVTKTLGALKKINVAQKKLLDIPPQVLECTLTEIQPMAIKSKRGHWTRDVIDKFNAICKGEDLLAQIYSVVDCICSVILFKDNLNINEMLITEGNAISVNENYLSKYDHNRRIEVQSSPDKSLRNYDIQAYLDTCEYDDEDIEPPPRGICDIKLTLRGPYSPLVTQVHSILRSTETKRVHIESESVNSILLDSNPNDRSEKMIVAAVVANSGNTDNLVIRQTTLMPNYHGFAPILALLFAPSAEIRRSSDKTRYISVLTGLGYNEGGKALFPEHDLKFTLDSEFKEVDIHKINHLRFIMNQLVYTPPGMTEPSLSTDKKFEIQTFLKKEIIELFGDHRKIVPLEYAQKEYDWNSLDKNELIQYREIYSNKIFPFHQPEQLQKVDDETKKKLHNYCDSLYEQFESGIYKFGDNEEQHFRCELCNQNFSMLMQLRIHVGTQLHRQQEDELNYVAPMKL